VLLVNQEDLQLYKSLTFRVPFVYFPSLCYEGDTEQETAWHWGAFVQPWLQWKSNKYYIFWERVWSLMYPACNAHTLYCHLWPASLSSIFPQHLINGTIFFKKSYW